LRGDFRVTLPLVPPDSQFDGGPLAPANCTLACGARLLLYATDTKTTGSALRQCQDDQSGGTSIPDTVKALRHCHDWGPSWAAPDEGRTPMPPGRTVDRIRYGDLGPLVTAGNMVLVQIVYEKLGKFREQFSFVGGHALTLDAYDIERGFYAVDPIPKPGSGYKGRWIPEAVIRDATDAMSGSGWVYAAWAKPKATPPPPEEDMDIYATPGRISYTAPVGTPVYRNPGDTKPAATIPDGAKRFDGVVHPGKADGSGPDKS
jgi:hypothetical protein